MTDILAGVPRATRTRGEIGAVGLPIFAGYLTLDPNRQLRGTQAVRLYREMRDDEPAASALWFAVSNLLKTELYVEPGGTTKADKRAAAFLEECLLDMRDSVAATMRQLQGFLWAGWGIHEIVYKRRAGRGSRYDDGRIGWASWALRRQDSLYRWGYNMKTGRVEAFSQRPAPTYDLRVIPLQKCVHLVADESEGSPEGRSLFRPMYRQWYFIKNLELLLGISLERFGTGLPVFEIDAGVSLTAEDKATLEAIAASLRQNEEAYVITPYGIKFRFEPSPGVNAESYTNTIQRMRTWALATALADFVALGTGDTGSFSLGKDKSELFLLALNGFQERMVTALNRQAVNRLFRINDFGALTEPPRLALPAVQRYDLDKIGGFAALLSKIGALTVSEEDEAWFRTIATMPARSEAAVRGAEEDADAGPEVGQRGDEGDGDAAIDEEDGEDIGAGEMGEEE